jgi:hypothetical protein
MDHESTHLNEKKIDNGQDASIFIVRPTPKTALIQHRTSPAVQQEKHV